MMKALSIAYEVRPYRPQDEPAVLDLLRISLDRGPEGARTPEFFRWKHLHNPFGRSFMLVADAGGDIVGLRAFLRWEFSYGTQRIRAVRAVDTATHPSFQGMGIFSRLTMQAIDLLRDEVDFIFNTPNERSLPGYLKMGWRVVSQLPIHVRFGGPVKLLARAVRTRDADPLPERASAIGTAVSQWSGIDVATPGTPRIVTVRSGEYLRWRYEESPLRYQCISSEDGVAVFRVRPRGRLVEATVSELLAVDRRAAARLLRAVVKRADAHHVAAHFSTGTIGREALRRSGFVRAPRRMTLVARPLRHPLEPDPLTAGLWGLTTGDVEVF